MRLPTRYSFGIDSAWVLVTVSRQPNSICSNSSFISKNLDVMKTRLHTEVRSKNRAVDGSCYYCNIRVSRYFSSRFLTASCLSCTLSSGISIARQDELEISTITRSQLPLQ